MQQIRMISSDSKNSISLISPIYRDMLDNQTVTSITVESLIANELVRQHEVKLKRLALDNAKNSHFEMGNNLRNELQLEDSFYPTGNFYEGKKMFKFNNI